MLEWNSFLMTGDVKLQDLIGTCASYVGGEDSVMKIGTGILVNIKTFDPI